MKKTLSSYLFFSLLPLFVIHANGESFKDFSEKQDQELQLYTQELERDFAQYKKIIEEEFKLYKKSISKYWEDAQTSGAVKWVEYSKDKRSRRSVDFEKGEITIDLIVDEDDDLPVLRIKATLEDLLSESKEDAFNRDELSSKIEEKLLQNATSKVKTEQISKEPLLVSLLSGERPPNKKEIAEIATGMLSEKLITQKSSKVKGKKVFSVYLSLPDQHLAKRADRYRPMVKAMAEKRGVDPSLVLAVMHTESSFNPMAKSHVPAYGLMQIVPRSAGKDATKYMYGKPTLLAPSFLYDDKNNVEVGSIYFYILSNRYLKHIQNPQSRLYCAIAAYNTGSGNVARAFTGKRSMTKAADSINGLTPDEVFNTLKTKLPHKETRTYLQKVSDRMGLYRF